jgi:hypothetical protein
MFKAHPLVGNGPGTFQMVVRKYISAPYIIAHHSTTTSSANAHNQILQVLANTGLIGMLGYICVASCAVVVALKASASKALLVGSMVVYGICAMFNPVVHSATFILCALLGAASRVPQGGTPRRWLVACFALAAAVLSLRATLGEFHFARAAYIGRTDKADRGSVARELRSAYLAAPWDQKMVAMHLESLMGTTTPEMAKADMEYCLLTARKNLRQHPNDSHASEIAGKSVLMAYMMGMDENPSEAGDHFERAEELAPTFPGILSRRIAFARALGDRRTEYKTRLQLQLVEELAHGKGGHV